MFIPSCNHCGRCGCVCGRLPYTVTVEFSGLVNRTHSQHCALTFASCFGSGASGVAMSPGGTDPDDRGPLASVLLLEKGCGYAVLGREQSSVSIAGSGSGATFTPTLLQSADACGRPVWQIDSVAVSGGTGYTDGESLSVSIGGVATTAPSLTLRCERIEPELTATVDGTGAGGVLSVTVAPNAASPATWGVASVSVVAGGSGYTNGDSVVFSVVNARDAVVVAAVATITTSGGEPDAGSLEFLYFPPETAVGTGATFAFSWVPNGTGYDLVVTLTGGGSGYQAGEEFLWTMPGDINALSAWSISAVDGSGSITEIVLLDSSPFAGSEGGGAIASVSVSSGGQYFRDSGAPESVEVNEPGEFYAENPALPAIVANVTVTAPACGGTGEEIAATVNSTPGHPDFGRITALSVQDGGENHLAWEWVCTNHAAMNGEPLVLVADSPTKLVTLDVQSSFGSGACLRVVPAGNGTACDPPTPVLYDGLPGPIREVEIVNAGSGYARVTNGVVEVATITVNIVQLPPSNGTVGAVSVSVDDDPDSPSFGEIVGTSVTGGSGYVILGAPRDCSYSATPCPGRYVSLELQGHGKPPMVRFNDPGVEIVFQADDVLDDCDTLPGTASLLYGAPAGATATIVRDGAVNTECDYPSFCDPCLCPLDDVIDLGSTPVSWTVTGPLTCDGDPLTGGGTVDALTCDCPAKVVDGVTYTPSAAIELECCDAECNDDGECVKDIRISFATTGYQPIELPGITVVGAAADWCTDSLTVDENGSLSGTATLSDSTFTVTITFG